MRPAPEAASDADATTTGISATFVEDRSTTRQFPPYRAAALARWTAQVDEERRSCDSARPKARAPFAPAHPPMLFAGSILDRAPGRTYTTALRFAELALRAPLPRAGTLTGWRAGLPADFKLALRAPRASLISAAGPLRIDAALETSLQWVIDAAQALSVTAVVLPTPADLTPGARSRELLRAYVSRLPRVEGRHYVWAPAGVWEPEDADPLCADLGLLRAFDPLETRRPPGDAVYATLRAMGHRSSFSQAALEDALDVIEESAASEALISVDAERGFDIAKRLQRMAALRAGVESAQAGPEEDELEEEESDDEGEDEDEETLDDTP